MPQNRIHETGWYDMPSRVRINNGFCSGSLPKVTPARSSYRVRNSKLIFSLPSAALEKSPGRLAPGSHHCAFIAGKPRLTTTSDRAKNPTLMNSWRFINTPPQPVSVGDQDV